MSRITAMALAGGVLAAGTVVSFTEATPGDAPARAVRTPCAHEAAHGLLVHVKRHVRRHLQRV